MVLGKSKSQIDALGKRLRGDSQDLDDLRLLQEYVAAHGHPMREVQRILRERLDLRATSRLKTRDTIIQKIQREKTRLSTMQDVAGVRVVEELTLGEQDTIAQSILSEFRDARVDDRRSRPSFGYRAVHVIVALEGLRVEVQVRTILQDLWAQAFEGIADRFGRDIRYGATPMSAELIRLVEIMSELSERIATTEVERDALGRIRGTFVERQGGPIRVEDLEEYEQVRRRSEEIELEMQATLRNVLKVLEEQGKG